MFLHLSVILFGEGGAWQTPSRADTPTRQTAPPHAEMATSADGTRPNGMHSCVMLRERFFE